MSARLERPDAVRYLRDRSDKMAYGTRRARDLEIGTGLVEGAVKHVVAKRFAHGGMRWMRSRPQAVIQLHCVNVNRQSKPFVSRALDRMRAAARDTGRQSRLQTNIPAQLPSLRRAA